MKPPSRLARAARRWQAGRARGLVSPLLLQPGADRAVQVHRRVLLATDRGVRGLLDAPATLWASSRWWFAERHTPMAIESGPALQHAANEAGVPAPVAHGRLAALRTHHGVPPREAVLFDLIRDGRFDLWPTYVYAPEWGWNLSASAVCLGSARAARHDADRLADKLATTNLLNDLGLPVAPTLEVVAPHALETAVSAALERWGAVFVKPRQGFGGWGAATIIATDVGREIISYGRGGPGEPISLAHLGTGGPLLVQPLLRSPSWGEASPPRDILTLRIVTRNVGGGPQVFSEVLEVPAAGGFRMHRVQTDTLGPDLFAAWSDDPADRAETEALTGIVEATALAALRNSAIVAHQQFPNTFAVAWDIAVTEQGPVFLEGNTGFGTRVPQMAVGGLLASL